MCGIVNNSAMYCWFCSNLVQWCIMGRERLAGWEPSSGNAISWSRTALQCANCCHLLFFFIMTNEKMLLLLFQTACTAGSWNHTLFWPKNSCPPHFKFQPWHRMTEIRNLKPELQCYLSDSCACITFQIPTKWNVTQWCRYTADAIQQHTM